jgi:hypothetical protein
MKQIFLFLSFTVLFVTACVTSQPVIQADTGLVKENPIMVPETAVSPTPWSDPLPLIILPISLYIVDDVDETNSSIRDEVQVRQIYEKVNHIWGQANIVIDVQIIQRITLPVPVLEAFLAGDFQPFFAAVASSFIVSEPSLLNGFYAKEIGGANGIVPFNGRVFFVMDNPSVHHERVSSHEIGHILGLHHVLDDPDRLMFSGTNGMTLSPDEITAARYIAQGMLDHVR